jgi:trehalose 6-phosphate synthase/phosphatase
MASRFKRKSFVLAMGDDRTDEDLFRRLPRSAWTVRVGDGSTTARFRVSGPDEAKGLLRLLIA